MFKKFFSFYFSIIFILVIVIYFFQLSAKNTDTLEKNNQKLNYYFSNSKFTWPVPGNYTITSSFGPRKSPTSRSIF